MFDWLIDSCTHVHDFLRFRGFFLFIASNYCCLRLLSPQLWVSPVALPVAAAPGVPTDLRFPPLWELRDRVGGTHLQKGERPLSILSPFSPTPTSSKSLLKGHFLQVYLSCVEIVDKASFSLWLIVGTWYWFLLLGTWYWYLVLGPWWYLTSATITVSVSSSKLLFPLPELFRKLMMKSKFRSQSVLIFLRFQLACIWCKTGRP